MRYRNLLQILAFAALAAHLPPSAAQKDAAPGAAQTGTSDEAFRKLRSQCEAAACSKTGGDVCIAAADSLLDDVPPIAFFEMSKNQRTRIAVRLLEIGVRTSNLARARAYDVYSELVIIGTGGQSDPYRARELMDMMVADAFPGGLLRRARQSVGLFSGATDAEKAGACKMAKDYLAKGGLDADSTRIARDILGGSVCTNQ